MPLQSHLAAEEKFQRFKTGNSFNREAVQRLLDKYEIQGQITHIYYGNYRKIIVWIEQNETEILAKIALHPYSVQLMRQEALGYRLAPSIVNDAYSLPDHQLIAANHSLGISLLSRVRGTRYRLWKFPPHTMTSLGGIVNKISLAKYIENKLEFLSTGIPKDDLTSLAARIIDRYGNIVVSLSPSHGDFASWNLLRGNDGKSYLLDLEYFKLDRVAFFDDWHWFIFPFAWRGLRLNRKVWRIINVAKFSNLLWMHILKKRYQTSQIVFTQKEISPNFYLVLYLFEESARLLKQHQLPDIIELVGRENYLKRIQLLHFFQTLLKG